MDGLKIIWQMIGKIIKIVWLCKFRSDINNWDLKILYRNLKSWKILLKKLEWNEIVWRIKKIEKNKKKIESNEIVRMRDQTGWGG